MGSLESLQHQKDDSEVAARLGLRTDASLQRSQRSCIAEVPGTGSWEMISEGEGKGRYMVDAGRHARKKMVSGNKSPQEREVSIDLSSLLSPATPCRQREGGRITPQQGVVGALGVTTKPVGIKRADARVDETERSHPSIILKGDPSGNQSGSTTAPTSERRSMALMAQGQDQKPQ